MKIVLEYKKIGLVNDDNQMVCSIRHLAMTDRITWFKNGKIDHIEETRCSMHAMVMLLRSVPNLTIEDKCHTN